MGKRTEASQLKSLAPQARELAVRISSAFEGNTLVTRFVDGYVAENSRPGLIGNPVQRRELMIAIRREALLALTARAHDQLPLLLLRRRPAVLSGSEVRTAEHFREECLTALGRELLLFPEEVEDFRRDLDLYTQLGARQSTALGMSASRGLRSTNSLEEGPFVDRAAFLLDPSLMEKARVATAAFLRELHALADQALAAAFRVSRSRPVPRKSRPHKLKLRKPEPRRPRRQSRRSSKKRR
jgi:hypothetical protein